MIINFGNIYKPLERILNSESDAWDNNTFSLANEEDTFERVVKKSLVAKDTVKSVKNESEVKLFINRISQEIYNKLGEKIPLGEIKLEAEVAWIFSASNDEDPKVLIRRTLSQKFLSKDFLASLEPTKKAKENFKFKKAIKSFFKERAKKEESKEKGLRDTKKNTKKKAGIKSHDTKPKQAPNTKTITTQISEQHAVANVETKSTEKKAKVIKTTQPPSKAINIEPKSKITPPTSSSEETKLKLKKSKAKESQSKPLAATEVIQTKEAPTKVHHKKPLASEHTRIKLPEIFNIVEPILDTLPPKHKMIITTTQQHDFVVVSAAKALNIDPSYVRQVFKSALQTYIKPIEEPKTRDDIIAEILKERVLKQNDISNSETLELWGRLCKLLPEGDLTLFKARFIDNPNMKAAEIAKKMGIKELSFNGSIQKILYKMQRLASGAVEDSRFINYGTNFLKYRAFVHKYLEATKESLSQLQYEALRLFFVDEVAQKTISEEKGVSQTTVYKRVNAGIQAIKKALANIK